MGAVFRRRASRGVVALRAAYYCAPPAPLLSAAMLQPLLFRSHFKLPSAQLPTVLMLSPSGFRSSAMSTVYSPTSVFSIAIKGPMPVLSIEVPVPSIPLLVPVQSVLVSVPPGPVQVLMSFDIG